MNYKELAADSRVWIYQSNRKLTDKEAREIKTHGEDFIAGWAAHGADLKAAFDVFYNQFIVLFADESQVKASGCSIDSSVRFIKEIEKAYKIDLFDRLNLAYEENGEVNTTRMNEFQEGLAEGKFDETTIVFNNLVETKGDFDTKWKVQVRDSWHAQLVG